MTTSTRQGPICGCVVERDRRGREMVQLCPQHAAEFDAEHEDARRSGSHVAREESRNG